MQETNLDSKVVDRLWLLCGLACHPIILSEEDEEDHKWQKNSFSARERL